MSLYSKTNKIIEKFKINNEILSNKVELLNKTDNISIDNWNNSKFLLNKKLNNIDKKIDEYISDATSKIDTLQLSTDENKFGELPFEHVIKKYTDIHEKLLFCIERGFIYNYFSHNYCHNLIILVYS